MTQSPPSEREVALLTAELVAQQDSLAALHELSVRYGDRPDLAGALEALVDIARQALRVRQAFARLELPNRPSLVAGSERGDHAALTGRWLEEVRRLGDNVVINEPAPALLLIPLFLDDEVVGVLGLSARDSGRFATPEIKLLQALTTQLAVQIEMTLRQEERVAQAALNAQLALAKNVQRALLPDSPPAIPGVDTWYASRPLHELGGDFCDFINAEDGIAVCVGDVCGKGVAASILMNMTRTTLRNAGVFLERIDPAQVVTHTNQALYADYAAAGMFTSLFVGQFVPESDQLLYANAGHAPVIYCPAQGKATLLPAAVAPVGILPGIELVTDSVSFSPGDVLLVATDGITEAMNDDGELFGHERLLEAVTHCAGQSTETIGSVITAAVAAFSGETRPTDDQTVFVCKRTNS